MSDEYEVSVTPISEIEEEWLKSQKERELLLLHQCLAALFDILGLENKKDASFKQCVKPLFEAIGKLLGLSSHSVRQYLQKAKKEGILRISAPLAITTGIELQKELEKLEELANESWLRKIGDCLDKSPQEVIQQLRQAKIEGKTKIEDLEDNIKNLVSKNKKEIEKYLKKPSLRVIVGEVKNRYLPGPAYRVDAVAEAAADYFFNVVPKIPLAKEKGQVPKSGWIGVSGGNTMLSVVRRIKDKGGQYKGLQVIPLAGEAEPEKFEISANSVVLRLSEICDPRPPDRLEAETDPDGPHYYSLMTTPIVANENQIETIRTALKSTGITEVIGRAKRVKFAFTGIGGRTGKENDALSRLTKYCFPDKPNCMPDKVVGDICYQPIDENGKDAWQALSRRLVGLSLEDLREMSTTDRRVFAVACGQEKVKPIIAAFRGGLVNGLITDELTALDLLDKFEEIRLKKEISTQIEKENTRTPLSDQELADILKKEEGIDIAESTVTKYREQMNIEPACRRKTI